MCLSHRSNHIQQHSNVCKVSMHNYWHKTKLNLQFDFACSVVLSQFSLVYSIDVRLYGKTTPKERNLVCITHPPFALQIF